MEAWDNEHSPLPHSFYIDELLNRNHAYSEVHYSCWDVHLCGMNSEGEMWSSLSLTTMQTEPMRRLDCAHAWGLCKTYTGFAYRIGWIHGSWGHNWHVISRYYCWSLIGTPYGPDPKVGSGCNFTLRSNFGWASKGGEARTCSLPTPSYISATELARNLWGFYKHPW